MNLSKKISGFAHHLISPSRNNNSLACGVFLISWSFPAAEGPTNSRKVGESAVSPFSFPSWSWLFRPLLLFGGYHKRGGGGVGAEKIEFPLLLPPFTPLPPFLPPKKQRKDGESSSLPLRPPSCKSIFFRSSSSVEGGEKKLWFFPLTHHSISHVTPLLFSPVQNNRVSLQIKNLLWLPSPFSRGHAQAVLCVVKW